MLRTLGLLALVVAPRLLWTQERGATALGEAVAAIGVTTRVLVIGAHPDDEDTFLISWLSRGRHVETAYLSLTRGDGGQNLIGNELGEALGVIRTEELLAARRIDGAQQFFTRAYDFGFSKDTIDTYKHWPRDSILGDVIRVVRAFRPHVIVAVFSGTPRDGHGHHQVSGLLAREAYELSGDTVRFPNGVPPWTESSFGRPWTVSKFYRNARGSTDQILRIEVGEYSPLLGRSYAEIAGESRSQHKSQGFGVLQRKGSMIDQLRVEASRVGSVAAENSLFDGLDTTWARFAPIAARSIDPAWARMRGVPVTATPANALSSLPAALATIQKSYDPFHPERLTRLIASALSLLELACPPSHDWTCVTAPAAPDAMRLDFGASAETTRQRLQHAMQMALGLEMEVAAPREVTPIGGKVAALRTVYNRGTDTVWVPMSADATPSKWQYATVPPGGIWRDTSRISFDRLSQPWWLERSRRGDVFDVGSTTVFGSDWTVSDRAAVRVRQGTDSSFALLSAPVAFRLADPVRGEIWRSVAAVPGIAVTLEQRAQYLVANSDVTREIGVRLRSAFEQPRVVRVQLALPKGLLADSAARTVTLAGYDATQTITFRVRGRLPAGQHMVSVSAESEGQTFTTGYDVIDYDHIRRQRLYRPATLTMNAVDIKVPSGLKVGYIAGVGDNVAPTLAQVGLSVTVIPIGEVASTDLTRFTTVVIGPRAYEAHPELAAANPKLFDFARKGGTLVVQYGQFEMAQPGMMPYPLTFARPADRVTEEDAPVTIDAPSARELTWPNKIDARDFAGWVQERALYMPRTFDPHYRSLLSMNDTGEPPNKGAILILPMGSGAYVYTTLSLFRQLPAGNPGAAKLIVNLLAAGLNRPIS